MARRAAGGYREIFAIEKPVRTRNSAGAAVETWEQVGRICGSYEATSYYQAEGRRRIQALVYTRYTDAIRGDMRLRWESRNDRILYISSLVERGNREDIEITVEEVAA